MSLPLEPRPTEHASERGRLATPVARIGVILPTSNRMIEPQLPHYAPNNLGVHFARAQLTGRWKKPIAELAPEVARAAVTLADAKPDLIVFNCTTTSMTEGAAGDAHLLRIIRQATDLDAVSTAGAITDALAALQMRRFVLITPYAQATNDRERAYFSDMGFEIAHDVALGLHGGDEFIEVSPQGWTELACANDRRGSDGFLLACTNTTQIEAVEAIEAASKKPVVNSNQAVLWAVVKRLRASVPALGPARIPGRLNLA
jgi:maleate isomerase